MAQQTLHWLDYVIILLSLAVSLWVGLHFARKQNSTNSYFAAGGNIPSWAIGMSLLATLVSSVTFLAYPGEGFSSNWILLVQGLAVPAVLVGMIWFIVPLYRKVIGLSTYEYFEKRFGKFARFYSSLAFILTHFSKMGTVFFLMALALASMTGANVYMTIWVIGLIIIAITLLGGIEAVIWLDVIQGFMLIAGGIVCLVIILYSVDGGPAAVWEIAEANDKTGFGPYDWDLTKLTFVVMALNGVFYAIQKYGTDQTIVQRYLTARTDKSAVRASLMGVLLTVPLWALFMFIGTALFVYYQQNPLPDGLRPDAVFPHFINTKLPIGVTGLILSALIAAAISSLDSDLNCLAAVGVADYYKRFRPHRPDSEYLKVGKWIVVASGLGAILIATLYLSAGKEGVLGIVFTLYAIFSGGIAGIFLLGLFSSRANRQGLNIGIVACILFTSYAFLTSTKFDFGNGNKVLLDLGAYNFTHHKYMLGVYSHLIVIGVGYLASLFFPKPDLDRNLTFRDWNATRKLEKAGRKKEEKFSYR
ncbi:sodium:solute symporter [Botryobacter ruber]|uniref:sodium:solute symporter n=1 Tax=Botryobacter ruber TaxID=2171629 RepID=UPI000E0B5495|nr:sodium:solute symporter [Botryobacter ruber]